MYNVAIVKDILDDRTGKNISFLLKYRENVEPFHSNIENFLPVLNNFVEDKEILFNWHILCSLS